MLSCKSSLLVNEINIKILLALLFLGLPLFADEVQTLKELMSTTQKSLEGQERVLEALIAFQKARIDFVENSDNARLGTVLVKTAMLLQREAEREHLTHLFSPDFLYELQFFNQVGEEALQSRTPQ